MGEREFGRLCFYGFRRKGFYQRFMIGASLRVAVSRVHETAHFGEGAMGLGKDDDGMAR